MIEIIFFILMIAAPIWALIEVRKEDHD